MKAENYAYSNADSETRLHCTIQKDLGTGNTRAL